MQWDGLATFVFEDDGDVCVKPVRPGLESAVHEVYVRAVLPIVMLTRGFEALHASAVRVPAGVIAFCGVSGTGKSTTALALAQSGLEQYADDTMVYRFVGDHPLVVQLPFPVRAQVSAEAGTGTAPPIPPGAVTRRSAPLHRIYQLVRDSAADPVAPRFNPVQVEQRFPVLLTHAHPFDMATDDRRRAFLTNLMTLARMVDVWECRFAPDLRALPSLAAAIRNHAEGA